MRFQPVARYVFLALLVIGLSEPAVADLWYEHYERAEEAIRTENWTEAIAQLNQAIEKKADPGVRVRTYGMNFINYHPYLKLGVAYHSLGQHAVALEAFDTEESLGAVQNSPADLESLQSFRQLANDAKQDEATAAQERIKEVVQSALAQASQLEREGQLEGAMTAVGRALAVDQSNAEATAVMDRLRNLVAGQERARETNARVASLVEQGRSLLAAGDFQEASSVFSQALSLDPSDEIRALRDESQEKLRAQLQADRDVEDRRTFVAAGLAEARRLESAGQFGEALDGLQAVLAVDPENRDAMQLQTQLLAAQQEQQQEDQLSQILRQGQRLLEAGQLEEAVAVFNRAVGMDPTNADARQYLNQAFLDLNRFILGAAGPDAKLPPGIQFVPDLRITLLPELPDDVSVQPGEEGEKAQIVSSADFVISGTIVHQSPARVQLLRDGQQLESATIQEQKIGELYLSRFAFSHRLKAGLERMSIVATDEDDLVARSNYFVFYDRPIYAHPFFPVAIVLAFGAAVVVFVVYRVHRRNRFLKRRFNPYVAGAPILKDDLFVGRERLMARVLQSIHNNSVLLYGERRIGKTSFQHQLKRRLEALKDPEYDFYPVFIDLQGTPQERFFSTIAEDVLEELGPVLGDRSGASPKDGDPYTYQQLVRALREVLKTLGNRGPKRAKLVLLMDEVDQLNDYDPKINQKLRSLFMRSFAEDLVAVVSGVAIKKRWASEGSPWYNFFEEIQVRPFRHGDARELIERPIRGIFKFDKGVMDNIIDRTECKPYLIQRFCVALVNRLHEEKRRTVTGSDVEAVAESMEARS